MTLLMAGPILSPTAQATTGGPDAYGYVWVNNRTPSPITTYSWVDIVPSGVRLTLKDDDCTFEVNLGFQFRYYGAISEQVFICSNGFITFGVPDRFSPDPPIPSPSPPNNRIVGLGIDLNPAASGSGSVYYKSEPSGTPKRFIVTWNGVYTLFTTKPQTFQIILEQNQTSKDGRVLMQYRTLTDVTSALVGIENRTGSSGLAYPGPLGNTLAVAFLPPSDAGLPPDQLRVTASSLAPANVQQGAANVPMAQFDFSTTTNEVNVTSLRVELSGLRAGPEDVLRARLWLDNGDGTFTPGADTVLAASSFAGSPPTAPLDLSNPLRVTMTSSRRAFLTYDLTSQAGIGDLIGARLAAATSVSVAFPDRVDTAGFPFDTYVPTVRTRIDASQDTLGLAQVTPRLPGVVSQWETDVPALSLRLTADRNSVELTGVRVTLGGNASASDVWAIKALRDRDGDGEFTPGTDDVLALSTAAGVPPTATLSFPLTVFAGTPETLLFLLDITPNATVSRLVNITVRASDFLFPGGSIDRVDGTNFPARSGDAVIAEGVRPALLLRRPGAPPKPDGIWEDVEYLLGPAHTAALVRPAGNRVPGYVTAENNETVLFVAVDARNDVTAQPSDGVAIAFDTDMDGVPTPGADDVFVRNATAGGRFLYNATAGTWTRVADCGPNATAFPACATGVGVTPFQKAPHRFYEFAIPLTLLGVPIPIPAGTTIRFALTGPPHHGLADDGNRSTWPLVFAPSPPLAFYGELVLATGAAPNRAPSLDWTGEPGYISDGVDPDAGFANDTFRWRITYADPDNDPPAVSWPRVHIFQDGFEIAGSPYLMSPVDLRDMNYLDGRLYAFTRTDLVCGANYSYRMTVRDARGIDNETPIRPGPTVWCPDQPPALWGETVAPFVAAAPASFTYQVAYADPEGLPPRSMEVLVQRGGVDLTPPVLSFAGWVGAVDDYVQGAVYAGALPLSVPALNYTFRFRASDDNFTVESPWLSGPYVLAPPPTTLTVAAADRAPLMANEGTRLVPMLQLYLLTSSPSVNVTGIRVDRIGTALDAEVESILLYRDADDSGSVTPVDALLGVRAPLLGTATFPVSLRVLSGAPISLLFLVNLTRPGTADATVGLEVRDSSYITVGLGSNVQPFPAYPSTRLLVNVPPQPSDLRVDGFADGSAGIRHILSDQPALSWRYTDPNAMDVVQGAYNVSVWSVSPSSLLWARNASGAASSAVYGGPALEDGKSYVLRVSLYDGRLWSAPLAVLFRTNTPPPPPSPFAPVDLATGLDLTITLVWQPVSDVDGDAITYWYWVSDEPGFATAIQGATDTPGVTLTLQEGTTYFWKVGASDGYEFGGNVTVWRFTTKSTVPVVRGEVAGRVLNGTRPVEGAFVELLANGTVYAATITGANGTFRFLDLDLRRLDVRVSAFGFHSRTLPAEPRQEAPVVDLGDVALTPITDPGNGNNGNNGNPGGYVETVPGWVPLLITIMFAALAASLFALAMALRRRRRPEEAVEDGDPQETSPPGANG